MNKQASKRIIKELRKKYIKKHLESNSVVVIYVPKSVKTKIDQYSKENGIEKTRWIRNLIISKLEKHNHKRYDYKLKKFVEIEETCDGRTEKKLD
jgi:hypothetical protein